MSLCILEKLVSWKIFAGYYHRKTKSLVTQIFLKIYVLIFIHFMQLKYQFLNQAASFSRVIETIFVTAEFIYVRNISAVR